MLYIKTRFTVDNFDYYSVEIVEHGNTKSQTPRVISKYYFHICLKFGNTFQPNQMFCLIYNEISTFRNATRDP